MKTRFLYLLFTTSLFFLFGCDSATKNEKSDISFEHVPISISEGGFVLSGKLLVRNKGRIIFEMPAQAIEEDACLCGNVTYGAKSNFFENETEAFLFLPIYPDIEKGFKVLALIIDKKTLAIQARHEIPASGLHSSVHVNSFLTGIVATVHDSWFFYNSSFNKALGFDPLRETSDISVNYVITREGRSVFINSQTTDDFVIAKIKKDTSRSDKLTQYELQSAFAYLLSCLYDNREAEISAIFKNKEVYNSLHAAFEEYKKESGVYLDYVSSLKP
jgi:hypothetical protein